MRISDDMRRNLVDEFRMIREKMVEEENPLKKMWWYSGCYGIVFRAMNFEFDPHLVFLHSMLNSSYAAINRRVNAITQGDRSVILPDDYFQRLAAFVGEIADLIERDEPTYEVLEKIAAMIYITTGNGYFLHLKGFELYPSL